METTMGRVLTEVTLENLEDLWEVERQQLSEEQARRVVVSEALVDTGATFLSLPSRLIEQLGLRKMFVRKITSSIGPGEANVYGPVRLTIQDRICHADVLEVADSMPVLIGQIALVALDLVVDPGRQRLIGNPAHGGEHIIEAY